MVGGDRKIDPNFAHLFLHYITPHKRKQAARGGGLQHL
jgi:hypothetical protein